METPRRRSSRLQGVKAEPVSISTPSKLPVVTEAHEQPDQTVMSNIRTPIRTPRPAKQTINPEKEEMHPARYQNSMKKAKAGELFDCLEFGMTPPATTTSGIPHPPSSPAEKISAKRQSFAAPDYEFKFRQSTDMSNEAQKLMDEVREQAARIKGELEKGREQQERGDGEVEARYGRKIATPKGKNGRYSSVHKEEFRKMESIADHASTFRAGASQMASQPSTNGTTTTKVPLKPAASAPEVSKSVTTGLKRNASIESVNGGKDDMSNPAKRRRTNVSGLINRFEKTSQAAAPIVNTSNVSRPATSTQPSRARADSVKSMKPTNIPSFPHSITFKPFSTPTPIRTYNPQSSLKKARTSLVQRITNIKPVKSVLRRPNLHYTTAPTVSNPQTTPHITTPKASTSQRVTDTNITSLLPDVHASTPASIGHRKEKHALEDDDTRAGTPTTPSPIKATATAIYPTLHISPTHPHAQQISPTPAGTATSASRARASVAGTADFTFRANKVISFSPSRQINPALAAAVARSGTPTIRRVRASDASYLTDTVNNTAALEEEETMEFPNVPHGLSNKKRKRDSAEKKKMQIDIPVFGQESANGGSDKENSAVCDGVVEQGSPSKRMKMTLPKPVGNESGAGLGAGGGLASGPAAARAAKAAAAGGSRIPMKRTPGTMGQAKGKSVMSLSRLNALAKPKERV